MQNAFSLRKQHNYFKIQFFYLFFFFQVSFDLAEYTADTDAMGTLRILEAIKICNLIGKVKFYQVRLHELNDVARLVEKPLFQNIFTRRSRDLENSDLNSREIPVLA